MAIIELNTRQDLSDPRQAKAYHQLGDLITALNKKELTPAVTDAVNAKIKEVNASAISGRALARFAKAKQGEILRVLEKEMKLVPRNYYRNLWLALGMTSFGLPLGVAFGIAMKNMGLLGLGLPIGMGIGLSKGTGMDKKAEQEGRQLDFEPK